MNKNVWERNDSQLGLWTLSRRYVALQALQSANDVLQAVVPTLNKQEKCNVIKYTVIYNLYKRKIQIMIDVSKI